MHDRQYIRCWMYSSSSSCSEESGWLREFVPKEVEPLVMEFVESELQQGRACLGNLRTSETPVDRGWRSRRVVVSLFEYQWPSVSRWFEVRRRARHPNYYLDKEQDHVG